MGQESLYISVPGLFVLALKFQEECFSFSELKMRKIFIFWKQTSTQHVNNLQILVASHSAREKMKGVYLWALAAWKDLRVEYLSLKYANYWLML